MPKIYTKSEALIHMITNECTIMKLENGKQCYQYFDGYFYVSTNLDNFEEEQRFWNPNDTCNDREFILA